VSLLADDVLGGLGVHEKGNNQAVKTQDFGENENQNHADEETGLLSSSTDTGVTNDTNGETSSETSETDRQTSTELDETSVEGHLLGKTIGDEHGHDETVNSNDTSHNDGNNVLDDQVRAQDTHSRDTDTGLRGTVRGTKAGEDDSHGATHGTEKGRIDGAKFGRHFGGLSGFGRNRFEEKARGSRK